MAQSTAPEAPATPTSPAAAEPRPTSERQRNANRRNAAKSTGPKTVEGKAASRENALKHGLCTRRIVMPGEDESEFRAYEASLIQGIAPANNDELDLARRIAKSGWHLDRADSAYTGFDTLRIQASKKDHQFPDPNDHRFNLDFLVTGILHTSDADTRKFERYHVHAQRAYHRNREALRKLQNDRFRRERSGVPASLSSAVLAAGCGDPLAINGSRAGFNSIEPVGATEPSTIQMALQQIMSLVGQAELAAALGAIATATVKLAPAAQPSNDIESTVLACASQSDAPVPQPAPAAISLVNSPQSKRELAPAASETGIGFVAQNLDSSAALALAPAPTPPATSASDTTVTSPTTSESSAASAAPTTPAAARTATRVIRHQPNTDATPVASENGIGFVAQKLACPGGPISEALPQHTKSAPAYDIVARNTTRNPTPAATPSSTDQSFGKNVQILAPVNVSATSDTR